jgi:hypothetical protein
MPFSAITYDPGTGAVGLTLLRGPVNFFCGYKARVHDNVATSGIRERIFEANDMFLSISMPHMLVSEDLSEWTAFMKWALKGGEFDFCADVDHDVATSFPCVLEDDIFEPTRTGPGKYGASMRFRLVPGARQPSDPGLVMSWFYGGAA